MGSGTTFKEISAKKFGAVQVTIPPLVEQERIVARIEELFTDLTTEDIRSIETFLSEAGLEDYKVQGMDTIMVPSNRADQLRAQLIYQGYPNSGTDYSLYLGKISALSTESDRAQMVLFQTQTRLEGTIRCFTGVKDAVVNITPSEDRRFVLGQDDALKAKASVVVTMKEGEKLSEELAEAIKTTVSHSIKGLDVEGVSITDNLGNEYDGSNSIMTSSTVAALKLDLEDQWNKKLNKQVLEVLAPIYGEANVAVAVNTTVEMSTAYSESTEYDMPEYLRDIGDGRGLLGKRIFEGRIIQGEGGAEGVVGTDPNADLSEYVERYTPTGDEEGLEYSGEEEYENNKTVTQRETVGGYISDISVSVSINNNVPNTATREDLVAHVARAAGINEAVQDEKVSIITHAFWSPTPVPSNADVILNPFQDLPLWVYLALLAGLFLFMMLFTVFVLLGRHRNRRRMQQLEPTPAVLGPVEQEEEEPAMEEAEPVGADIMDVHTERSMELRKSVREMAENNPEIAAQMIKALLRGDEDGNGG